MPDLTDQQKTDLASALDAGLQAAEQYAGADVETLNFSNTLPANQPSNDVVPDDVPTPPEDHPDAIGNGGTPPGDDDEIPGDEIQGDDPTAQPSTKAKPAEPAAPKPKADDPASDPANPLNAQDPPQDPATPPGDTPPPDEDAKLAGSLKGRTKQRFEELTGEVKQFAPMREALTALEIDTPEALVEFGKRAKYGEDMVDMVMATGANAEQYRQVLDYMTVSNQAIANADPAKAKAALDMLAPAVQHLSALAGVDPTTLIGDPLDADPELKKLVDDGDMTREKALSLVSINTRTKVNEARTRANDDASARQNEIDTARGELAAFDAEQMAADPTGYGARRAALNAQVIEIRKTHAPKDWRAATERAYAALKLIPVAAAPTPPAPPAGGAPRAPAPPARATPRMGPVRAGGHRPPLQKQYTDPAQALDAGLKAAFGEYDD